MRAAMRGSRAPTMKREEKTRKKEEREEMKNAEILTFQSLYWSQCWYDFPENTMWPGHSADSRGVSRSPQVDPHSGGSLFMTEGCGDERGEVFSTRLLCRTGNRTGNRTVASDITADTRLNSTWTAQLRVKGQLKV